MAALWGTPQPAPDGTIDQGDRQQVAWIYRGILATELVAEDIVLWTGRVLLGDMWVGEVVE